MACLIIVSMLANVSPDFNYYRFRISVQQQLTFNHTKMQLFKAVAERGKWTRLFTDAEIAFSAGDADSALVMYLLLAEMGFEVAQSNAAFLLEKGEKMYT